MVKIEVKYGACSTSNVIKFGLSATGKQRVHCHKKAFILDYSDKGRLPEVKGQIIDMALNGSGIRGAARVLGISINAVIVVLKKRKHS